VEFRYTPEQLMVRDMVRDLVSKEIRPRVKEYEARGEFPHDVVRKIAEVGLAAPTIPEKYGGGGVDNVAYCLALEEIAKADASTAVTVSVNNSVCCGPIHAFGTEEQKARYLVPCARGEFLGGFALTEPGAGSDAAALRTRARRRGDGSWVLDGTKAWITNAGVGKLFVVIAVTDPAAGTKGMSAFLVEDAFPGFRVGKEEDKLGLRSSKTAQVILEECVVPGGNLLGGEGEGLKVALATLDGARVGIAAQAVGIAQGAYEEARAYARTREAFGKPIAEHQAIAFMLADMAVEIDAARLLTHRAAWLRDRGRPFKREASMAKLYASEMSNRVTYQALQVFGGYGYSKDYPVERFFRDARVTTIYEGTSEIQRFVIAREILKD
jgi:alkylation response protein AidB-like acyl-CoA dehydrogenase